MKHPVLRALLLSLLLHFVVIGGVELGHGLGLWKQRAVPDWLIEEMAKQNAAIDREKEQNRSPNEQNPNEEPPLLFVDVDASQAEEEAPKESKHYAVVNTKAGNAQRQQESNVPNLTGTQEVVPKVTDTLKANPESLQPAPKPEPKTTPPQPEPEPPPQPKVQPKPEPAPAKEEPKPPQQPGETMIARANPEPPPRPAVTPREQLRKTIEEPRPKPERPRTLAEARRQKGILEGQRMRQDGGVGRIAMESVDARATPFGAYDAALIAAVQARWYTLLEDRDLVRNQAGRVVVEFRLHSDGRVTNVQVTESQVSETLGWLCQRAVIDPNPYAPFPNDLKRMLNTSYREVRFSFYYTN